MKSSSITKLQKEQFNEILISTDTNLTKTDRLFTLAQTNEIASEFVLEIIDSFDFNDQLSKIDLKLCVYRKIAQFDNAMKLASEYEELVKNKTNNLEYVLDIALHKIFFYFNNGNKDLSVKTGDDIIGKVKIIRKKK